MQRMSDIGMARKSGGLAIGITMAANVRQAIFRRFLRLFDVVRF